MVITRKSQVMLNFLDIRVVINEKEIYPLQKEKPVVVQVARTNTVIVATDGFHFTPRLLVGTEPGVIQYLHVACTIDDNLFFSGFLFTVLALLLGIISDFLPGKILCFLPVAYLLYAFYLRRKYFLKVIVAESPFSK